jgi:4-amino-4-deoxychorismate lyase
MTQYPIININGEINGQVSALDRGFTYGDGFFETCYVHNNKIHLWNLHLQRLQYTAKRLLIILDTDRLHLYIQKILQDNQLEHVVLKIQITRGETLRGYAFTEDLLPNYSLYLSEGNSLIRRPWLDGVKTRVCDLRLSSNPALAGLKHLNRLENILARAEWKDEFMEGLLLDQNNYLIEGTMSNIFLIKDNCLLTPALINSGVAGVMRKAIMEMYAASSGVDVKEESLTLDDLAVADEVFLCNSLIGIWPVIECVGSKTQVFKIGDVTRKLQAGLMHHVTS